MKAQTKVQPQKHAGVTLAIASTMPQWHTGDDITISATLTNGTGKDIRLTFDAPQIDLMFEMVSTDGKRVGCDPEMILPQSSISIPRLLKAGASFQYTANLARWKCPTTQPGIFTLSAQWQLDDWNIKKASSTTELIKSNSITLEIFSR